MQVTDVQSWRQPPPIRAWRSPAAPPAAPLAAGRGPVPGNARVPAEVFRSRTIPRRRNGDHFGATAAAKNGARCCGRAARDGAVPSKVWELERAQAAPATGRSGPAGAASGPARVRCAHHQARTQRTFRRCAVAKAARQNLPICTDFSSEKTQFPSRKSLHCIRRVL